MNCTADTDKEGSRNVANMLKLPGYSKFQQIYDQPHVLIFRALRDGTNESVLLKVLRAEYPTSEEIQRYETEFEILKKNLGPGVPRAIEMIHLNKSRVMVLEDIGGKTLLDEISGRAVGVSEMLDLCIDITKILAKIQEQGIIHCDLKPANVVVNKPRDRVQIIDFGLAIEAKHGGALKETRFSGTLQYMSPEQTGRTQRSIDYRSDFYSLGVTFYQMFSGQLPFAAKDDMEWIHNHIAQTEVPLHLAKPGIPKPISQIVQKLMKKSPDERYQSCIGIVADLQACREMVNQGLGVDDFEVGLKDLSAEFRLSPKLYGRENEIETVNKAVAKVVLGGKRIILVGGEPGVGKTSIANVIKSHLKASKGYFIFGKFDQFRKDVPFSGLILAFNQLVGQILAEDEAKILVWKQRILAAVGNNAGVVTALLPQLQMIVGDVPALPELQGNELKARFQTTLHNFIQACCEPGRPLVLFLDDLQWADSASRSLLHSFICENKADSFLFVGAYRDNQIGPGHPLLQLLRDFEDAHLAIDRLTLAPLKRSDIQNLIEDSFRAPPEICQPLAELVFEKTQGNPFFVSQFLKDLFEKNLLNFRAADGWTWSLEDIRKQNVTSNVLDLLSAKIKGMPAETRDILTLSSCFGNQFRVEELKSYNGKTDAENTALLEPSVRMGLILSSGPGAYKFIHDRVQEAAYTMLSLDERQSIHWQIAGRLLKTWDEDKIRQDIFYVVNHWNAAATLIQTAEQRETGARLNLQAGSTAKDAAVYDLSLSYATQGIVQLASSDWKSFEHYLRPLHLLKAESEFAMANFDEAEKTFRVLVDEVQDPVRQSRIFRTLADMENMRGRPEEAIVWGRKGMAALGFGAPPKPSTFTLIFLLIKARWMFRRLIASGASEVMVAHRPASREMISLGTSLATPAYQVNKKLLFYMMFTAVILSLKEKFVELNGRSYFVAMLWQRFGAFEEAKRAGTYLHSWLDRLDENPNSKRSLYNLGAFCAPVLFSFKEAIKLLERGLTELYQTGDLLYSTGCAHNLSSLAVLNEAKLSRAEEKITEYYAYSKKFDFQYIQENIFNLLLVTKALQGKTVALSSLGTEELSEEQLQEVYKKLASPVTSAWLHVNRILLHYIAGEHDQVLKLAGNLTEAAAAAPFAMQGLLARGLGLRITIRYLNNYSGMQKWRVKRQIRKDMKYFKNLARFHPNFQALYLIARAEQYKQQGKVQRATRLLEDAIVAAQNSEMPFFQALANEQLAEYFTEQKMEKIATVYLRDALFFYENWGAKGKVDRMLKNNPELAIQTISRSNSSSATMTATHTSLDINTILKASNTLISEIDMSKLVEKLLNILIENAGAERGVLILRDQEQFVIRGQRHVRSDEVFQLTALAVDSCLEVARALISYVARTQETIVLEDASNDDRVSRDEYVQRAKVLSTVCMPLMSKGEVKGMIYLENNSATGVFSPDRVELIQTLAGQIAISIENALLYQQQAETIRMQNELATAQTVQEMLFPLPSFESESASIAGYYRPATECGGDWWYYSQIGEWTYIWIGDATGHGAPAALVTSAACSAVAVLEASPNLTPESAMSYLNQAICRTTKGKINMTFFVGALNNQTGEFRYVRASHDPPYYIRADKNDNVENFSAFRGNLETLQGLNGRRLGESTTEEFEAKTMQLQPGDYILFYTDGLPDVVNPEERTWGERGFLSAFYEGYKQFPNPLDVANHMIKKADEFGKHAVLADDITVCILKFKGAQAQTLKKAS